MYLNPLGAAAIYDSANSVGTGNTVAAGVPFISASRWAGSAIAACLNGGAIVTASFDGSMGSGGAVGIGHDGSGGNVFSGLIGSIEIANSALSDANLQRAARGLVA